MRDKEVWFNLRFLIIVESLAFSSVCISRMIGVVIEWWWLLLWSIDRCVVDIRTEEKFANWTELIDSVDEVEGNKDIWINAWCPASESEWIWIKKKGNFFT